MYVNVYVYESVWRILDAYLCLLEDIEEGKRARQSLPFYTFDSHYPGTLREYSAA